MKDKIAISMDAKIRARIDAIAKSSGESRSQVIERLCAERIENDYVEFVRITAFPTQIREFVNAWAVGERGKKPREESFGMVIHDDDGPIEMVLRVSRREWETWAQQRREKGQRR